MHQLEVFIYKIDTEKVRNIDKTTETLSDDDWEELDSQ